MANTKITGATDIVTLAATDVIPIGRPGNTTKYNATLAEVETFVARGTINVMQYGAVGNGVADDTAAIQAAWTACGNHDNLYFAPGKTYKISDTLSFNDNLLWVTIQGNGAVIMASGDMSNKAMINLAGSAYTSIYNLSIRSIAATPPAVGLLLGRTGVFHGSHDAFVNVFIEGYFTHSCCYNVGSEVTSFYSCTFENNSNNAHSVYISNYDVLGLLGVDAGQLTGYFYGCTFHCFGTAGSSIYITGRVTDYSFIGCYGVPPIGGHFIHADTSTSGTQSLTNLTVDNCRVEPNTGDNSASRFFYQGAIPCAGLNFRGINWNMNSGAVTDPDYIYEFTNNVVNSYIYTYPNTFTNKTILFKNTSSLINSRFWGDVSSTGLAQVTVEAGVTMYRSYFYWTPGALPFDAVPAGMAIMEFVANPLSPGTAIAVVDGDTTPTVCGGTYFQLTNTNPTTITDFDDGYSGQEIYILSGDFVTTVDFSGTNLKGNDGVDYLLVYPDVVRARNIGGTNWYCEIIKS